MRVLACGGRHFGDVLKIWRVLDDFLGAHDISLFITGGAPGADYWANSWAMAKGLRTVEECADWREKGKGAGAIRNQKMLETYKPEFVIAFTGGTGTADMVRRAKRAGINVIEVSADG